LGNQGVDNPKLIAKVQSCWDSALLEDLYLPYKPKRKTRASMARERGLQPLADVLMAQNEHQITKRAKAFLNKEVPDVDAALAGARDIIAETINENPRARETVRRLFQRGAVIESKVVEKNKDEGAKYKDYFDFTQALKKCPSHRLLAMRRGEEESILKVSIGVDAEDALLKLDRLFLKNNGPAAEQVNMAMEDAYKRLLAPSMETEFRKLSKAVADQEAIGVFSENLRQLLLAAPLGEKPTLAIDPGFRTGCKVVCIDEQGDLLEHTAIFPHPPQKQAVTAKRIIKDLVREHRIEAIAIGNGTAGRETEDFIKSALGKSKVDVFMVNESGASIYSASEVAREEFPDLDLTVRGAISIGRRLMDPLAELVKIDAKSIGVGQYQHDVDQKALQESLDQVVSSAVNQVGVNLNTASPHLLRYVSGIGPKLAKNIVKYRDEIGAFSSRKQLKKVKGLGLKAFEQSAGFLRIPNAGNPLDNSAVHPESYPIVEKMAKDLSKSVEQLMAQKSLRKQIKVKQYVTKKTGLPTLNDIMSELEKPGLDPRGKAETFSFADGIRDITDLRNGMRVPGVITNLTKFGAFVDIGIKENGLIHISQITDRFISDPAEVLKLDQKVMVRIVDVDLTRKRIQLSLKEG
jgi:uncharacterized protein